MGDLGLEVTFDMLKIDLVGLSELCVSCGIIDRTESQVHMPGELYLGIQGNNEK